MPASNNWWIKIDPSKKSNSIIERNRLVINKLNKYDLNNFECVSEHDYLTKHKILELDREEYMRNVDNYFSNERNLNILLLNDVSDLRIGGIIYLKCTNEGNQLVCLRGLTQPI